MFGTKKYGNIEFTLRKHKIGFFQVDPMPTEVELEEYYSKKYYQNPTVASYALEYSLEELKLHQVACDVTDMIYNQEQRVGKKSLFDIGCGEGFFLKGMQSLGWDIAGTDYSSSGVKKHNSEINQFVTYGNAINDINSRLDEKLKYSLLNLGNVLEHVLDPVGLLTKIKPLISKDGLLRIVVPNDASDFQQMLKNLGCAEYDWIHPPDHISYFNFQTLKNLIEYCGYELVNKMGDFPIELYLLNKNSNYIKNRDLGKDAHLARVKMSNFISERGIEAYIKWSEGLAAAEIARTCIFFVRIK
jgi:SAM-dependent methyltransferase